MALTQRRELEVVGTSYRVPAVAKTSQVIYPGALLVADSNGLAAVGGNTANEYPLGFYTGQGMVAPFESLTVGSSTVVIETLKGKIWVPFTGAAQSDVGERFFIADEETVTKTQGNKTYCMVCEAYKPGFVLLDFDKVQYIVVPA